MGMAERDPERVNAALLARRATLRADPELIAALAGLERSDAIAQVLNGPVSAEQATPVEKSDETVTWWLRQIGAPGSGLHERMSFFWHSLLPTHRHSVPVPPGRAGEPSPVGDLDRNGNLKTTVPFDRYLATLAQDSLGIDAASVLPDAPEPIGII